MPGGEPRCLAAALEWLRKHFDAEAARGASAAYRMELSGPGGGRFLLRVEDGLLDLLPGSDAPAQVVLRLAAADYYGILAGRENADLLYMAGRIEVEGDLQRAMKLRTYFRA